MLTNRQRLIARTAVLTLVAAGVTAGAAGLALLYGGWYNIGATAQHFPFVYTVLEEGMTQSVRKHAQDVKLPQLGGEQQLRLGAQVYRDKCVQCHGGPGVAQASIGMSMQPIPGPLVDATQRWTPRELYWVTKNGIKMSGMPAWEYHLRDEEIWAVVAFVTVLPRMSAQDYRVATAQGETQGAAPGAAQGGAQ
jgi:mono/diheme cytochrome c family protein